jgi:hypothetical protein
MICLSMIESMTVLNVVGSLLCSLFRSVFVAESICSPALHAVNVHTCAFHKHLKVLLLVVEVKAFQ